MKTVQFTDENNNVLGRAILKNGEIIFEGLQETAINGIKSFGVIDVVGKSMRQIFPDGPDPELFLKNLKYEFSGSAFRAGDVQEVDE